MDSETVATVTLRVGDQDVTVELEHDTSDSAVLWHVKSSIGEDGKTVQLTVDQKAEAIKLAGLGVDETGR